MLNIRSTVISVESTDVKKMMASFILFKGKSDPFLNVSLLCPNAQLGLISPSSGEKIKLPL